MNVICPSCESDSPGIRGMVMGVFCDHGYHTSTPDTVTIEDLKKILLDWYHEDGGVADEMTYNQIYNQIDRQIERYAQLVELGIDPYPPLPPIGTK